MKTPTQSELIRETHRIVSRIDHDFYGNGTMGVKTKVDWIWNVGKGFLWLGSVMIVALIGWALR